MKRPIATAIAALLMLGLLAGPAAAEPKAYLIQPLTGNATVSKTPFFNDNDDCTLDGMPPPGNGLGLPIINGVKKGYWRIAAPLIGVPGLNAADLLACGKLNPIARRATGGIGAACGMSKGDGRGRIRDDTKGYTIHISNLVWKTTIEGTIVAIGHVTWTGKTPDKGDGKVILIWDTQGALACLTKTAGAGFHKKDNASKSGGANNFVVQGSLQILQSPIADETPKWKDLPTSEKDAQDDPAFCKHEDEDRCPVYGPKKQDD